MNYLTTGKVSEATVSLYTFNLRNNLAQGNEKILENADSLWHKIQEVIESINISDLENLPELIAEYEKNNRRSKDGRLTQYDLIFETEYNKINLGVRINPLKIHDTNVVDLTLAYLLQEVQLSDLGRLKLGTYLLPQNINASLGQSVVFFAKPLAEFEDEESLESFAEACAKALISEAKFQELEIYCQNKGSLLGSPIFEYNNDADTSKEQCHILIWLNTNPQITDSDKLEKSYYPLIELLLCRSKIVYARSEAIWCNQQARDIYTNLESKVSGFKCIPNEQISSCLNDFQGWLKIMPDTSFRYAHYIRDLEIHRTTIRTNITNYKLHLEDINELYNNDSQLFLEFVKVARSTYIRQITTDLAYLVPGQKLFENMVETIRGIVDIEEAKRDRSLERTIQEVGIALGGGAIVSGVVTQHIKEPVKLPDSKYPPHPITTSLIWSFIATIVFYCGAKLYWSLKRRG